jgi:Asp-tRNA(Asn)/Glu-tRNA(Gln) amidotransferase A subunit family amidase
LHGIPVGIKDIMDVAGITTLANSKVRANSTPATADAEIVAALRLAGAVILGKTHTTEFAYFDPSPARNPHNIAHTPGGSSSRSAAAVCAGAVPLAVGTQTVASVNRPAAYCGVALQAEHPVNLHSRHYAAGACL